MNNPKEKIGNIIACLFLILAIAMAACFFPYKEVLECNGNDCMVERTYIAFNDRYDAHYHFQKTDDIQATYHRTNKGRSYYEIENFSDYKYSIFNNIFAGKGTPEKLIAKIKSNENHIKITKYWLGHKIEK